MDDGSLYDQDRSFDVHKDIVVLPYSSGTTGAAKGVALTHYNMVANMCQVSHPEITMVRETSGMEFGHHKDINYSFVSCLYSVDENILFLTDTLQETTLAVLPFFHIYAMNTVMTLGLQIGAKLVTVPKFEPEMYIKALATYKVCYLVKYSSREHKLGMQISFSLIINSRM